MASEKSKLIARAVRGQSVFVYAASSNDPVLTAKHAHSDLNKKETSSFECSTCGTHMHVVASSSPEPYCVTCGSDQVIESNRKVPETAAFVNDTELSSASCAACDTENIMPTTAIVASGNSVHCVLCGSGLKIVSNADENTADKPEANEEEKADMADAPPVVPSTGGSEDAFPDLSATEDEEMADAVDNANSDEPSGEFTEGEDFKEDADVITDGGFMGDEVHTDEDYGVPSFGDIGTEEPGNEEELFLDAYDAGTGSGEPLVDALELNDTPDSLTFVSKASVLLAMKGAHVIAFATAKTAGKSADVLHRPEYARAVTITANQNGMRKALARFGFKNITVKPVDTAAVNKGIATAKLAFASTQSKKDQVFADSIAIAAAGLGRGLWREAPNPLKAALIAQLGQSMSASSAKTVASRILVESGLEYAKVLVSYASKLTAMSTVARKEFADMLDLVADDAPTGEDEQADAVDGDDDSAEEVDNTVDDMDDVTARFSSTAALLKAPTAKKNVTASAKAAAVLSGKAPLSFNY